MIFFGGCVGWFLCFFVSKYITSFTQKKVDGFHWEPWDFETKHRPKTKKTAGCVLLSLGCRCRPKSNHHEARDANTSKVRKKKQIRMKLKWRLMANFGIKKGRFAHFVQLLGFFSFSLKIVNSDLPTCRCLAPIIPATWLGALALLCFPVLRISMFWLLLTSWNSCFFLKLPP